MDAFDEKDLDALVQPVCRVVASGAIPVITIVPPLQLDGQAIAPLRAYACAHGVALSLDQSGAIVLRGGIVARPKPGRSLIARLLHWQRSRRPAVTVSPSPQAVQ